jgi:hypothetical protein
MESLPAAPLGRREALARVVAASGLLSTLDTSAWGAPLPEEPGIGTDPNLLEKPTPWARRFTPAERKMAAAFADTLLPADPPHPAASAVGVPDFLDEWVSAPYEEQRRDLGTVRACFAWLDAAAQAAHGRGFADLDPQARSAQLTALLAPDHPQRGPGLEAYRRARQLVIGGYYTTPEGWADIGYVGNRPIGGDWPGPPKEILARLGLAD